MVTINEETFLTVDQAFDFALTSLMATISEKDKVRIYIWRKRYKDGKLSHKKVADIFYDKLMTTKSHYEKNKLK